MSLGDSAAEPIPGTSQFQTSDSEWAALGLSTRTGRTLARLVIHVVNLASNLLGDDWLGKHLRVVLLRRSGMRCGSGTSIHGGTYFTVPWHLHTGRSCFVNRNCYFDLESSIRMGDDVVIGHGSTFVTTHHEIGPPTRRAGTAVGSGITIGSGTWIGSNVMVLPGVTIGDGAVVAAGAIVTRSVPANALVGGVPARVMRLLSATGGEPPAPDSGDGHQGSPQAPSSASALSEMSGRAAS